MNIKVLKLLDLYIASVVMALLKPIVYIGGLWMKRDHNLTPKGDILVIKLLGGGNLIVAYPGLLELKQKYPDRKLILLGMNATKPFADVIDVFDTTICLDSSSGFKFIFSLAKCLPLICRIDTVIDLEVHSRFTCLISLVTLARNRIGFYKENVYWRKNLYTHLIFYNPFSPNFVFYDILFKMFLSEPINISKAAHTFDSIYPPLNLNLFSGGKYAVLGFSCSDNGKERMLPVEEWARYFSQHRGYQNLILLGAKIDFEKGEQLLKSIKSVSEDFNVVNLCGKYPLRDSIRIIKGADIFLGVDSSLLHIARLLGKSSISFWGPTDPMTRLRNFGISKEHVFYKKISCSPCIHFADIPPCQGNNQCMRIFSESKNNDKTWLLSPSEHFQYDVSLVEHETSGAQ